MNPAQSSTRLKGDRGEAAVLDNAEEVPLHGSNALELEAAANETAQSSPFRRALASLPWQTIGAVVAFGLFSAVAYVIYHELAGVTWAQVHDRHRRDRLDGRRVRDRARPPLPTSRSSATTFSRCAKWERETCRSASSR